MSIPSPFPQEVQHFVDCVLNDEEPLETGEDGRAAEGHADDGQYLLQGTKTWLYPDGTKQREATYERGCKVGKEIFWAPDGAKLWEWEYGADGRAVWTQ